MKLKKILASILCIAMVLGTIGVPVFAIEYKTFDVASAEEGVIELEAGTYTFPDVSGKTLTIKASEGAEVVFDMGTAKPNLGGANLTFEGITFNWDATTNYKGLQHAGELKYNNCTINGQVFLYGTSETFNNCVFNQNNSDAYNVWTYGAKDVTFNKCTFNSAGKSVLIYAEDSNMFNNVTVTDCDFIASASVEGKAAIEMDSSLTAGISLTIDSETTATGFGEGSVSGNSLWNNKKGNSTDANNDITVVVAEETVLEPVAFVAQIGETKYASIQEAITAAKEGDTVKIAAGEYSAINISNKNITIQGTVGDNGELLTTIKGGNPAITGHSFNGTIKDIKIVDAWKVMYAEPAGNVSVDNVYVTGATYGFHLVAYSPNLTWKIENSYMDLAWANSFGVYGDGYADIIIRGNEFVTTNPYYPEYGAIHVNSFLPSVTIEENIFGKNAKIYIDGSVTDTSKIKISKNYHADGVENAFADDADGVEVEIDSYYKTVDENGNLAELVVVPKGTITVGYTSTTRVWGEGTSNSCESFVVELYAGDVKIAQASLKDYENIIDGDVYVTWGIPFDGTDSDYWDVEWYGNNPIANVVPTKVVLIADGKAVAENVVKMNAPDDLNKVEWDEVVPPPSLPTATVTELDTEELNLTSPLTFALNFKADDATDKQLAYYDDWYADYVLTVNKTTTFNADGSADGYLAGQYDAWSENWVYVPFEDVTLEANTSLKIMEYAAKLMGQEGLKLTYNDVYSFVKDFDCGIFFDEEFLAANPDLEVTLELKMFNPQNEEESYAIGEVYKFTADDAKQEEISWYSTTKILAQMGRVSIIGTPDVTYGRMRLFAGIDDAAKYDSYGFKYKAVRGTEVLGEDTVEYTDTAPYDSVRYYAGGWGELKGSDFGYNNTKMFEVALCIPSEWITSDVSVRVVPYVEVNGVEKEGEAKEYSATILFK